MEKETTSAMRARVLLFTGPGKGKTTAALGMLLRCAAYGKKILWTRFTKAADSGELRLFDKLGSVTVLAGDCGMTPPPDHPDYPRHVAAARELFERTLAAAPAYDAVFLDEICGVTARGMIAEEAVAAFAQSLGAEQILVLTGRGAGPVLLACADTASEVQCLKHGYRRGVRAQKGVEL